VGEGKSRYRGQHLDEWIKGKQYAKVYRLNTTILRRYALAYCLPLVNQNNEDDSPCGWMNDSDVGIGQNVSRILLIFNINN